MLGFLQAKVLAALAAVQYLVVVAGLLALPSLSLW
jgi:hypothetical protein